VIKIKGEYGRAAKMKTSEKIRKYAPPVVVLIILGFGGLTAAGLTFGAVIVIGSFICNMCLGSLFAAVGIAATVGTSIVIHKTRKDIRDAEVEPLIRSANGYDPVAIPTHQKFW
jgi:hypothetical protein